MRVVNFVYHSQSNYLRRISGVRQMSATAHPPLSFHQWLSKVYFNYLRSSRKWQDVGLAPKVFAHASVPLHRSKCGKFYFFQPLNCLFTNTLPMACRRMISPYCGMSSSILSSQIQQITVLCSFDLVFTKVEMGGGWNLKFKHVPFRLFFN